MLQKRRKPRAPLGQTQVVVLHRIAEVAFLKPRGPTVTEVGENVPTVSLGLNSPGCSALEPFSKVCNVCFQMFRMSLLLLPLWLLPLAGGSQRAEPMFTAVTNSVLPPDYDSNPTQLNYGVAVTDVDHDGDFEIVVAG